MRFLSVFALLTLTCLSACSSGQRIGDNRSAPLVAVTPVESVRFIDHINAVGTARANEQVTIAAPVTQRIVDLRFDDGDYVTKDQIIAKLAHGQETAVLADAEARETAEMQQLERLEALKKRGFATSSAVDTQIALTASARARAAEARAQIGDHVIRAPFSGWVSLRTISEGAVASAGTEIATISDLSRIKLDFTVPETQMTALVPGSPVIARAAAYPDEVFRGQISTIDPVINPATRAVTVRAVLPNPDRRLKPGMLMTVAIEAASRSALAVPELALVGESDQTYVYVLGNNQTVGRVVVTTGLRQNGLVEITNGLRPGQQIVTEGVVKLADGMKVRTVSASAPRN